MGVFGYRQPVKDRCRLEDPKPEDLIQDAFCQEMEPPMAREAQKIL